MKKDTNLTILGDVHLDKRFRTGVPLHRIGEREKLVWEDFERSLMECKTPMHVQTGDLFDQFAVSEACVLKAASLYRKAAKENRDTDYIVYRGNHDASRDTDKKSSFDVFYELMTGTGVHVLDTIDFISRGGKLYGFIPWHPFKSSTELAHDLLKILETAPGRKLDAVFGHWDVESFGGDDFNLVPTNVLKHITDTIYTGHIHKPTMFVRDGVYVDVVGSMQPYSHSEDNLSAWYDTIKLDELNHVLEVVGQDAYQNMNIRVLIQKGDLVPEVDCLSLVTKLVDEITDDEQPDEVVMAEFDMAALFKQSLTEQGVGANVMEAILTKFGEIKHA